MLDREGFRPNVGIVLVNSRNEVFWGKRIREHSWQFPQGGIKNGETPEQAMLRELEEETGLKPDSEIVTRGFGTTVIENMVGRSLGAEVERTLYGDGFTWEFRIPIDGLVPGDRKDTPGTGTSRHPPA